MTPADEMISESSGLGSFKAFGHSSCTIHTCNDLTRHIQPSYVVVVIRLLSQIVWNHSFYSPVP
jgi:hypothetical protein